MKLGRFTMALVVGSLLSVSACTEEGDPVGPTTPTGPEGTTTTTAPAETGAATSAPAEAGATIPVLPPVDCEGLAQEPTELQARFMTQPGPFGGDAFDAAAAARAVAAMNPSTDEEVVQAIASQVQGGYGEDMCEVVRFSTDLGAGDDGPTQAEQAQAEVVGTNHFALVLDSSGSMAASSGGTTRMEEAKGALRTFVQDLPVGSTVSLRVYGHEGSNSEADKQESCASSEVVYEGPADESGFEEALGEVQPVGWTPLAKAIEDSAGDIPQDATDAMVYVVTDGLESCEGDPVQAAEDVAGQGVEPVINVIGFQVGDADQEALSAIAEAGGGSYTAASSADELDRYWREEQARLVEAWRAWRRAEVDRLSQVSSAKLADNQALITEVQNALVRTQTDATSALAALRQAGSISAEDATRIRPAVVDHYSEIRPVLGELRSARVEDIKGNLQGAIDEVYATSDTAWTELYREQNSDD